MVSVKKTFWPVEPVGFPVELPLDVFLHSVNVVDFHIHAAFEILIVISGGILLYTEFGGQRLMAEDVAIVHGWQPHATQALGSPNMVLALQFDPAIARHDPYFASRRFDLSGLEGSEADQASLLRLRALAAQILLETRMKRSAWQMEVEALLLQLLALLVRKVPHHLDREAPSASAIYDQRKLGMHLRNAADYIRRHATEPLGIEQVAAAHGLSSGYMSRLFKTETGGSFGSFLTHVRLLKSLDLLTSSNAPKILAIALDCGFPNVKSFNLAFRRAFDCVPTQWRQRHLAAPPPPNPYIRADETPAIAILQEWARRSS